MKVKSSSKIMLCVLTFLYIFGLKLFGPIDSTMLVGFILTFLLLVRPNYRWAFVEYIKKIRNYKIVFVIGLLVMWTLAVIFIDQTHDYSYLITVFHLLFVIFVGVELATYFKYKGCADKIVNTIIVCFLIQTALQWIFLFLPDFSRSFNFLRNSGGKLELLQEHYDGRRGLALSGAGFFSLSSSYGMALLLYCSKYNSLFSKRTVLRTMLFFFLLTGTFFAGRTGFIALLFIPFLFFKTISKINKREVLKVFITLLTCSICVFALFSLGGSNERISRLYDYSFELGTNWFDNGELGSTSTDSLLSMYDVEISFKTFMIGDARYNMIDEYGNKSYYKGVDPGYLRKIFYFGIIGVILSFALQIAIYGGSFKKNKLFIILFIYMMVLEAKGEIIGLNLMTNSMIMLMVVCAYYMDNKDGRIVQKNEE